MLKACAAAVRAPFPCSKTGKSRARGCCSPNQLMDADDIGWIRKSGRIVAAAIVFILTNGDGFFHSTNGSR
jgi:hypothetical protein